MRVRCWPRAVPSTCIRGWCAAGFAVPTLLAHVPVIIEVRDQGEPGQGSRAELSAVIIVRSTFARHLADWLLDAAVEYGR